MNLKSPILLFLAVVIWPLSSALGQWGHAPGVQTPVCTLVGLSAYDSSVISDGAGGMYLTWRDTRNTATGYDIYAQRIVADGSPLWQVNGVEVCRFEFLQDTPLIVPDGAGGCIIVWSDNRIFGSGIRHLFAQRLGSDGNPLWTANGVRVCTSDDHQDTAAVAARAGGGVTIAWSDQRAAPGFRHIYAQALDLNGNRLLGDTGAPVATDNLPHLDIQAVPIAGNDTMILWRGNFSVIKAVRLSDPNTVIDVFLANSGTRGLTAISDGFGGVVAGIFRFFVTTGNVGVWAQRVSSDLQKQWGQDGVLLNPNTSDDAFSKVVLAADGSGGAYVAWHTEPGNNKNVYLQRVSNLGEPLWNPQAGGLVVADQPEDEEEPGLLADSGGVYVFWRWNDDTNGAEGMALRAQRYGADGSTAWPAPVDVVKEGGILSIREFGLAPDSVGGVVVGFTTFPLGGSLDVVAKRLLADGTLPKSRLTNISTRAFVGTGSAQAIPGFAIGGSGSKQLLVRAAGPSLAAVGGPPGTLVDPILTAYDAGNVPIAANDDWGNAPDPSQIAAVGLALGAFDLLPGGKDAAILGSLGPGSYTAGITGAGGGQGIVLMEVYDADPFGSPASLTNLSSRVFVGTGDNQAIPGFVISGPATMTLLIRAVGPTLGTDFGVADALADPILTLYDSNNLVITSNNDWGANLTQRNLIIPVVIQVGAFELANTSKDSALLVTLPPGSYTAGVVGANSGVGVGLLEIYIVP